MHLYGLDGPGAQRLLDSVPVVGKYDERDHCEFRTKRLVLAIYDATAKAARPVQPSPVRSIPHSGRGHGNAKVDQ